MNLACLLLLAAVAGCGGDDQVHSTEYRSSGTGSQEMKTFFPEGDQVAGIGEPDEYREFEGKRLFELINGGAEDYLALDFVKVGARDYMTDLEENPYLSIHVYDMSQRDNAISIFRKEGHGARPSVGIGEESRLGGGAIEFLSQRYYVKIRCDLDGPEVDRLLKSSGQFVLDRITASGSDS